MNLNLDQNVAVIVGGAQGIGRVIAETFAQENAQVVIVDRDPSTPTIAEEIGGRGWVLDVVDHSATEKVFAEIHAHFERLDHVVFCVGIGSGKFGFPFWNVEPAEWGKILEVNVLGAVHVAHAATPFLLQADAGTMLFLSSVAGQIGSQTDPPYSASKAALINFAQCAAKDLAPRGVRVNTLCPGMVKTALNRSVWEAWHQQSDEHQQTYEEWAGEKIKKVCPMGRWQEPEDIAAMSVFLASEKAKNVVGQTINVDGGFVMHW